MLGWIVLFAGVALVFLALFIGASLHSFNVAYKEQLKGADVSEPKI